MMKLLKVFGGTSTKSSSPTPGIGMDYVLLYDYVIDVCITTMFVYESTHTLIYFDAAER